MNKLSAILLAAECLEKIGFSKHVTSDRSVSIYYKHPIYRGALRVSDHALSLQSRRKAEWALGEKILASITFEDQFFVSKHEKKFELKVHSRIALAIGIFFMKTCVDPTMKAA